MLNCHIERRKKTLTTQLDFELSRTDLMRNGETAPVYDPSVGRVGGTDLNLSQGREPDREMDGWKAR